MNKFKILRNIFAMLSLVLTHWTCIVVALSYANMLCKIKHEGFSAPANTAFYLAVPYYISIIICVTLVFFFHKQSKKAKTYKK